MVSDNFWKKYERDIIIHGDKMNVVESCVDRHAEKTPDKIAFVFQNSKTIKYTYKQLQESVNRFANFLKTKKIRKNSRIFLFLPKIPEMYICFLGAIKHGSVACPLFEAFQTEGLELRLKRGDANVLVTNKELKKRIKSKFRNLKIITIDSKEYRNQIKKQSTEFKAVLKNKKDTALMMFTSSTAGTPVAGVQIPHYALVQQHFTAKLVLDLKPEDNYWCTAHPGWVTGAVYGILAPLSIGCTNYILESHFKAKKWISFLEKNKISVLYTAPTVLRLMKTKIKKSNLKYLRNLCSVGEALTKATYDFYKKLGVEINDTYWQTETGAIVIANWKGLKKRKYSMGKAIPGMKIRIKNKMIELKAPWPSMMTGIYKHPKMYKSYFDDGWFKTNDSARKDKQGYFFFIGRHDDIIKTRGERVSPIEIESILMKHKSVYEAAVIGVPHKIFGSILKAFVVLNEGERPSQKLKKELSEFVKKNYAGHSYPKEIEFIKEMPKTNSGKIIRMELRKLANLQQN